MASLARPAGMRHAEGNECTFWTSGTSPHNALYWLGCRAQASSSWRMVPGQAAVALASSCLTLLLCTALMGRRQPCKGSRDADAVQLNSTLASKMEFDRPCPPWLGEYSRFHAWSLRQPKPRFLVYLCGLSSADTSHETHGRCSGTGGGSGFWGSLAL